MVVYNFKKIQPVPTNKDFVDIVLNRTQRKTPTVVHAGYQITRIREFYMRKVRFTQQTFHEKLSAIVEEFPKLDDIHPFYADLINVLYDRDHYKLALGQVNIALHLIDNIAKDYLRMLKYGDSLFRCKQLKKAALGRMCTVMKKQGPTLQYLEEVRKHLARLPSIDPTTRTLLICGFPNVGKSSFMNKVTRAEVEVQPYAFTTKSLFVGHMDYKYHRWQVIDTPGILDHSLEERNPIEMQSITALAHLHCAVLFFLDISGHCGYSIEQQLSLFNNISPLFVNKPVVLVTTKIDVQPWETLDSHYQDMINKSVTKQGALMAKMSNFTEEGVMDVRQTACEALRSRRLEMKLKNNKKVSDVVNRLSVTEPKPRDGRSREVTVPEGVLAARAAKAASVYAAMLGGPTGSLPSSAYRRTAPVFTKTGVDEDDDDAMDLEDTTYGVTGSHEMVRRWLERDREAAGGGPGVWRRDTTHYYQLKVDEWKSDLIPEIMDGKNIADFVDPDIEERLMALEAEEEALLISEGPEGAIVPEEDPEQKALLKAVREKKKLVVLKSRQEKGKNKSSLPRTTPGLRQTAAGATAHLESIGLGAVAAKVVSHATEASGVRRSRGKSRAGSDAEDIDGDGDLDMSGGEKGVKRGRSRSVRVRSRHGDDADGDDDMARSRSGSRGRSASRGASVVDPKSIGLRDEAQKVQVRKLVKKMQRKDFYGTQGETDRRILAKMPKHLFSGKRGIGSADWR